MPPVPSVLDEPVVEAPDAVAPVPLETPLEPEPTGKPTVTPDPSEPKGEVPLVLDPLVSAPDPPPGGADDTLLLPLPLPPLVGLPLPVPPFVWTAEGAATLPASAVHPEWATPANKANVEHTAG
jgi:hypothetical protein